MDSQRGEFCPEQSTGERALSLEVVMESKKTCEVPRPGRDPAAQTRARAPAGVGRCGWTVLAGVFAARLAPRSDPVADGSCQGHMEPLNASLFGEPSLQRTSRLSGLSTCLWRVCDVSSVFQ